MSLFEEVKNCNSNKKDKQDNEDGDDDGTNTWEEKKMYFNAESCTIKQTENRYKKRHYYS